MFERAVPHGEFCLAAVFRDDHGMRSEYRSAGNATEKIKRAGVFVLGLVRRIEKDEVHRLRQFAEALQHGSHTTVLQGEAAANLQRGKVLAKRDQRRFGIFCKPHMLSPATQRFNSNCSGSGIKIDEAAALEARRKDIEEGFP